MRLINVVNDVSANIETDGKRSSHNYSSYSLQNGQWPTKRANIPSHFWYQSSIVFPRLKRMPRRGSWYTWAFPLEARLRRSCTFRSVTTQVCRQLGNYSTGCSSDWSGHLLDFSTSPPNGRILNRFTTDISTIDGALQQSARAALMSGLTFLASFSFILWVVPVFAPFAIFIAWLYIRIAPRYIRAARDLRRLESVSLSPAFAGFDELLRGLSHVRAFGMEDRFQEAFYKKVDTFQTFDHVYWLVAGWLRWRYDCG